MAKRLNFFTPINSLGYGVVGKNLALELNKYFEVALIPLFNQISGIEKEEISVIQEMISRVVHINFNDTGLMWNYGNQMWGFCGKRRLGYTIFETELLPEDWVNQLKQLDLVFVPSNWAKRILTEKYKIKTEIINCGVNINIFHPVPFQKQSNVFKFASIGKWEERKNQKLLVQAFCEEFKPTENVQLYGLWNNPFTNVDIYKEVKSLITNGHILFSQENQNATIFLCKPLPSSYAIASFIQQMDAFIFPFRAEGWCLPLLEAMACGKICIATYYSAATEFINENNCYLLHPKKFIPAYDGIYFKGDLGNWADIDKEELKYLLRTVYEDRLKMNFQISQNAIATAKKYRWENIGIQAKVKIEPFL
ncbi:MAG TPA: glycosyltransferase family 4 protein [bacterium]|nr:glycosyltransferase family 4 protein [bacterium]HOL48058.1 glycosyltransferase family 4 protein [bacterium]HPQ19919.1 glycosyltransferase family 4 protein [bacterium]